MKKHFILLTPVQAAKTALQHTTYKTLFGIVLLLVIHVYAVLCDWKLVQASALSQPHNQFYPVRQLSQFTLLSRHPQQNKHTSHLVATLGLNTKESIWPRIGVQIKVYMRLTEERVWDS